MDSATSNTEARLTPEGMILVGLPENIAQLSTPTPKKIHKQTNQPDVCFVHLPSLKLIAPTKNTFSKEKTHHFGALQAFVFQLVLSSTQGSELQKDRINPWSQLDEAQLQLVVLT